MGNNPLSFSTDSAFISAMKVKNLGVVPGYCLVADIFSISSGLNFMMFARWWSDDWCFLVWCFIVCRTSGEMGWAGGVLFIHKK